jgi:hypothetical protein
MTTPPKPPKPLKILTIDGGGLQAITTLLILDRLLHTIAKNNKVLNQKPRPCDVFDAIAGIGAGGWLAILLGRFHMDITACLTEWYKITSCISPRSKSEEVRMRLLQHCYFDPDRLMERIGHLTRLYGTTEYLFADNTDGVRTRHVFVAALKSDASDYNLFRTYEIPKSAALPEKLREGPKNPSRFKIARAFGVTGAAKYFTPKWKEQMATSGKMGFSDTKFPKPHNITELALDEMWGIYGTEVPLSVIVNIGPGIADSRDVEHIARRFSWGRSLPLSNPGHDNSPGSPVSNETESLSKKLSYFSRKSSKTQLSTKIRFDEETDERYPTQLPGRRRDEIPRIDTFGSIRDRKTEEKLKRLETDIEDDIRLKLDNIYGEGSGNALYYRLAPDKSPRGTALNDAEASGLCLDAAKGYLRKPDVVIKIDELARMMPEKPTPATIADDRPEMRTAALC